MTDSATLAQPTLSSVLQAAYEAHSNFTTGTAWEGSPGNDYRNIAPHCTGCGTRIGELEGYSEFYRSLVPGKSGYREGPRRQGLSEAGGAWQAAHIAEAQAAAVAAFLLAQG